MHIRAPPKSTCACVKVVEEYFHEGAAIDVHNHYWQGGLVLEEAWGATKWAYRAAATVIGMSEVCSPDVLYQHAVPTCCTNRLCRHAVPMHSGVGSTTPLN